MDNTATQCLTNNRDVLLLNVNRCNFLVNTRSNNDNTAVTYFIGFSVNLLNSSFNGTFRVTNTVTFKTVITITAST